MRPIIAIPALLLTAALAACTVIEPPAPRSDPRDVVVDEAVAQLDRSYRYRGSDPTGFDASGLVRYVYARCCGIELPHSAEAQRAQGTSIDYSRVRRGDLLFYRLEETPFGELHVGIYIGRSRMVHIREQGRVQIEPIDLPYWQRRLEDVVSYLP
ncbi:MAG TPA: C40 family peptidase [Nevskiales bacterium]|nr:C40 family peptidase [Nevskiales bacterium]